MTPLPRIVLGTSVLALAAVLCAAQDAGSADTAVRSVAFVGRFEKRSARAADKAFDTITRVARDDQGRIVVAGTRHRTARGSTVAIARFLPDGRADRTFGRRGMAQLKLTGVVGDMAVSGSRVVVCGSFRNSDAEQVSVLRLLEDGSLDPSFSDDGLAETAGLFGSEWLHVRVVPDDGAVVAVVRQVGSLLLVRLTPAGGRDLTFGDAGLASAGDGSVTDFEVDADGRMLVAGEFGVRRFLADGARDLSFGNSGLLATDVGGAVIGDHVEIELDAQGRIVVLGESSANSDAGVYRFLADGAPDLSFSSDALAPRLHALPAGAYPEGPRHLAIATGATERYVVVGGVAYTDGSAAKGTIVLSVDPSAPESLGMLITREPHTAKVAVTHRLQDVVLTDSSHAVVVGDTFVNRRVRPRGVVYLRTVDLTPMGPAPLPNLSIAFSGEVTSTPDGAVTNVFASVVLRNDGAVDWTGSTLMAFLSADDVYDAADVPVGGVQTGALGAGQQAPFDVSGPFDGPVAGMRLIVVADPYAETFVSDFSDDAAVSEPIR